MTWREFRQLQQSSSNRQAVNAAIRRECPGGSLAIDGLTGLHDRLYHERSRGGRERPETRAAYDLLDAILAEMEADVRRRHGLPAGIT